MAKTLEQVTTEVLSLIAAAFSPRIIDTRVGTLVRDAFVTPVAQQFFDAFAGLDEVAANQSIQSPGDLSESTMNGLAENFGISRFSGSPAIGIVRFYKVVSPTGVITIPAGTRVATSATNEVEARVYRTLASVQLTPSSPPDPITGAQAYVEAAVQASFNGESGNVDAGTVTFILDPVLGVDGVINPSFFSGGKESQTNEEMAEIIKARAQGRLGTRTGYQDLVLSNFSVDDVEVIGHSDEESTRDQFGGEVDVVVLSSNSSQAIETFAYVGPSTTQLVPSFRPLISVSSITGFDSLNAPITLIGPVGGVGIGGVGSDYDVILDTTGPYAGSFRENSKIVLHPTTNVPGNGTTLTATYANNDQIRVIQAFLDLDDNKILGADPLAKAGVKIPVVIEADIRVIPGFSVTSVQTAVQTAVEDYFDGLKLGDDVQVSDVITVIGSVTGVDFVDSTTFLMALASAPATPLEQILAKKHEFIRSSSVTINII